MIGIGLNITNQRGIGGLLNTYSGAAAAYSLRTVNTSYSGGVVRVRRSSDNAEQDFKSYEITNGSLTSFCGVGDGFVTIWYDQSNNANNATQTTAASQPKIVSAGSLVLENGKPALDFDGVDHYFFTADYILELSANPASLLVVIKAANSQYMIAEADQIVSYSSNYIFGGVKGAEVLWVNSTLFGSAIPMTQTIAGFDYDGTNFQAYINGVTSGSSGTATVNAEAGARTSIGARADGTSSFFTGKMQEIIAYKSDQSANRTGIEANINAHYGIY